MVTRLYLDTRAARADGSFPVKLSLAHNGKTALVSLDVFLSAQDWDAKRQAVVHTANRVALNSYLQKRKIEIDDALRVLQTSGALVGLSITEIRKRLLEYLNPQEIRPVLFLEHYDAFAGKHTNKRTREIYETTRKKILMYDAHAGALRFEDVTVAWLEDFNAFLAKTAPSQNTRAMYVRNIKAVFNDAVNREITTYFPFRKFMLKQVQTVKRSLNVESLRVLLSFREDYRRKYADVFALSFMLIGCNMVDLLRATRSQIIDGRFTYRRSKTKRLYSIKIEPEAQEIIDRLSDDVALVACAYRYKDYRDFIDLLNSRIKEIVPGVSTYWARHSWATIASSLRVSKDTIAKALGHGPVSVTDVYIDYDLERVDRANRLVLDYVLYNKTPDGQNIP